MEKLTVKEASELLGIDSQTLRAGIEQGVFPFAVAIKRSKWTYHIYKNKLEEWLGC